ncbi:hypothetical protein C8R43DRAFT_1104958, partial [Mycena crocata]
LGLFLFGVPAVLARPIIDLSEAPRAPVVPSQDLHQRDDGGAVIGGGIHHWFPFILYSSEENGNTGNIGTPAVPDAPQASKLPRGLSPQTTNGPRVENLVAIKHWFPFRNYLSEGNDQEDDTPHAPENILPRQTNNGPRVERATIKHWFPFRHYLSEENHDEDNTGTSAGDAPDAPLVDSRDPSKHTNRKSHIETAIIHWLPFVHYPSAGNNAENQESETPGSSSAARL